MLTKTLELELTDVKLSDEEEGIFSGYISKFNNIDSVRDIIVPGAFTEDLEAWKKKNRLPAMFFNHDRDKPVGRWIELRENKNGLFGKGRLSLNSSTGRDVYGWLKDGAVDGLSFMYRVKDHRYDRDADITYLNKLQIREAGPVSMPANESARIQNVKQLIETGDIEKRQLEEALREELGLSQRQAKALLSKGFEGLLNQETNEEKVYDANASEIARVYREILTGR